MVRPLFAILKKHSDLSPIFFFLCQLPEWLLRTTMCILHVCVYLFKSSSTELAVLASRPVVGSSKKRTDGSMISSIPIFVLFLSPPEIPRMSCVPTCRNTHRVHSEIFQTLTFIIFYNSMLFSSAAADRETTLFFHSPCSSYYIRNKIRPLLSFNSTVHGFYYYYNIHIST